jgi:signal transduction histidine kinase
MSGSARGLSQAPHLRGLMPAFALIAAVVAAVTDWGSVTDVALAGVGVVAFAVWAYLPRVPLAALCLAVLVPVVAAQRAGDFEPLLFQACLLAFVIGRWAPSTTEAAVLGAPAVLAPAVASLVQDPPELSVGIWIMGIAFSWIIGRALEHQTRLSIELDASRRELARQALHAERQRIARDVHDFVGHGLAAVMLQVTSARHVLRRDPASAEEALRSAEEVGRRSMQELRRTVALLRSDDEEGVAPPVPSAAEIPVLVDQARAGGLAVESRMPADLTRLPEGVGVALYRIAQEALANAARHAPRAQTVLAIEIDDGLVRLGAETTGPVAGPAADAGRSRYGLLGMRERAVALGGDLVAGPTHEGWRVSCRLPLDAEARR